MMYDEDGIECSVQKDNAFPNKVWVKRSQWRSPMCCTIVEYPDVMYDHANMVFSALITFPMVSDYIATPICYKTGLIAYKECSHVTLDILRQEDFPVDRTYDTVRRTINGMLDLHEVGVGGLPLSLSSFVRTENGSEDCKIYYASILRKNCIDGHWESVVQTDYMRMVEFVKELIEKPNNALELMKSEALFKHFIDVLEDHRNKSSIDKQWHKALVLGHPLLKKYVDVEEYLRGVAIKRSHPNDHQAIVTQVLRTITAVDWVSNVRAVSWSDDYRYQKCLNVRSYAVNCFFLDYCRDFMDHPIMLDLYHPTFSREKMIQKFEELYPSYIGLIWIALGEAGVPF